MEQYLSQRSCVLVGHPTNEEKIKKCIFSYEIRKKHVPWLRELSKYKIFLIADDSGTMGRLITGTSCTRWDELKVFARQIVEFVTLFNPHGINVRFLNRPCSQTVTDASELEKLFEKPPEGYTPLTDVLRDVLRSRDQQRKDEKFLIFIATDGMPTTDEGDDDLENFQHVMDVERDASHTHVMFLICTDDQEVVDYLRSWDNRMTNVDVTDDYISQKALVRKKRGETHSFTQADYVVKILVGAINPEVDFWDDDPAESLVIDE